MPSITKPIGIACVCCFAIKKFIIHQQKYGVRKQEDKTNWVDIKLPWHIESSSEAFL